MNETTLIHPDVCCRCASVGRTCCTVSSGDEEYCFPVSAQEMSAIRAVWQGKGECFVQAPNTAGFVAQVAYLMSGYDIEAVFPLKGTHWRLATTPDGRCVFLGEGGCELERSVRPVYCRLFPLWVFDGKLTWFTAEECLAGQECSSLSAMLEAMGIDSAEARALHRDMCVKLGLERSSKVTL